MGYSRKYPHPTAPPPTPWTTLNWVPKYYRIPNLADSRSWRIPEFSKTEWFFWNSSQNSQNLGKFIDFQSCSPSIFYMISNVVHGGGGGVDIFWNSPMQFQNRAKQNKQKTLVNECTHSTPAESLKSVKKYLSTFSEICDNFSTIYCTDTIQISSEKY